MHAEEAEYDASSGPTSALESPDWADEMGRRWLGCLDLFEGTLAPIGAALIEHARFSRRERVVDVGCGAGLLAEPLARLGAKVTAIDAAPELIAVARDHAAQMGLEIDYRAGDVQALESEFDLVTCMEVIEHVAEPAAFLAALARRLAPGGLLLMSTPNQTSLSRFLMITLGEGLGRIPKGTHDFDKFITPQRMKLLLADAGLKCLDVEGIAWSPARGLHLSDDVRLNYLVAAEKA